MTKEGQEKSIKIEKKPTSVFPEKTRELAKLLNIKQKNLIDKQINTLNEKHFGFSDKERNNIIDKLKEVTVQSSSSPKSPAEIHVYEKLEESKELEAWFQSVSSEIEKTIIEKIIIEEKESNKKPASQKIQSFQLFVKRIGISLATNAIKISSSLSPEKTGEWLFNQINQEVTELSEKLPSFKDNLEKVYKPLRKEITDETIIFLTGREKGEKISVEERWILKFIIETILVRQLVNLTINKTSNLKDSINKKLKGKKSIEDLVNLIDIPVNFCRRLLGQYDHFEKTTDINNSLIEFFKEATSELLKSRNLDKGITEEINESIFNGCKDREREKDEEFQKKTLILRDQIREEEKNNLRMIKNHELTTNLEEEGKIPDPELVKEILGRDKENLKQIGNLTKDRNKLNEKINTIEEELKYEKIQKQEIKYLCDKLESENLEKRKDLEIYEEKIQKLESDSQTIRIQNEDLKRLKHEWVDKHNQLENKPKKRNDSFLSNWWSSNPIKGWLLSVLASLIFAYRFIRRGKSVKSSQ